jgi:hypothetical protein
MFLDLWIAQLTPQCLYRGESAVLVRSLAMSALSAARVLLSAAVSRIEQRLNAQRRRTMGNRGTRRCEIRTGAAPSGPSSSAPEWRMCE